MDNKNTILQQARENKNDEFYTTYESVEEEMHHYKDHFRGKTVYCNADDPRSSEFSRYFQNNFTALGLKRLIVTSYSGANGKEEAHGLLLDMKSPNEKHIMNLSGNGDFRSEECLHLLEESDLVVTNPPFSLMREMISLLESHKKQYLLLATENVLTYKEVFPLVQQGKLWTGYKSGNMSFRVPDDSQPKAKRYWVDNDGQKWRSLGNVVWITNIDSEKHQKRIELTKTYSPEQYPKYDNYDAINVDKVENIPVDYPGVMGVPVTILKKINTEQFEIVGEANHGTDSKFDLFEPKLDGKTLFKKILIKNKFLMENEKIDNKNMPSPERVSFESKEDLRNYINDYCEKHGWDSDLNHIDTSKITDMSKLFVLTKFSGDISSWDVSNVTDMNEMFAHSEFNGDISKWDTSKVENMSYMFAYTPFNGDISGWNVSKVEKMGYMFSGSRFNQDISRWDVSNVKDMVGMFEYASFDQDLSNWDMSNVRDTSFMFYNSKIKKVPENWNLSKAEFTNSMFDKTQVKGAEETLKAFKPERVSFDNKKDLKAYITDYCEKHGWESDLNHIDVSRITDMSNLFYGLPFKGNISKWDVSNVTTMEGMFALTDFNGDISQWNTGKVTNMSNMFAFSHFNQPIGNWDTSRVKTMVTMFHYSKFNQPLDKWDTSSVETMAAMFRDSQFNQPIGGWNVSKVRYVNDMFASSPFNQPINDWNTGIVTDMSNMFSDSKFNQPINKWDTSRVRYMVGMFYNSEFNQPINDWNVGNVMYTTGMFTRSKFNQPLDKWNVSSVLQARGMFEDSQFNQDISGWKLNPTVKTDKMFNGSPYSYSLPKYVKESKTSRPVNKANTSKGNTPAQSDTYYMRTWLLFSIDPRDKDNYARMEQLRAGADNASLLKEAERLDTIKGIYQPDVRKHETNHASDVVIASDEKHTVIYNDNRKSYEVLRKVTGQDIRDAISRDGIDLDSSELIRGVYKQMVKEVFEKIIENSTFKMPNGQILHYQYDENTNQVKININEFKELKNIHAFDYDLDKDLKDNLKEILDKLIKLPEYQEKNISERVSFDNKEDLRNYIKDYCEKHGWDSDLNHIDVSKITDMSDLFMFTKFTGDISSWNVSNVKDMSGMFMYTKFNGDISNWNVSNVTDMSEMFADTEFNSDISKWDTGNVKDMSYMFSDCPFNGDISQWDVSNVTNMSGMFRRSRFNQPLGNWNTSNVTTMQEMFYLSHFNQPIGNWNVSNVKNMSLLFCESRFNQPLDNWKINTSADLSYMFSNSVYSQALPGWKLENTVNTEGMFKNTPLEGREKELLPKSKTPKRVSFDTKEDLQKYIKDYCEKHGWDSDLNHIDVSRITDMSYLFINSKFTGDISQWDTSNVKDMSGMFMYTKFNGDISNWNVSNVTNMESMFYNSDFNRPINSWDTSKVENMRCMFWKSQFNQPINEWDTSKVENMSLMFEYSKFNQPIGSWDVSSVKDMSYMFSGSQFNQPIGNWDISKVETMAVMFIHAPFNQNINEWNTANVKDMSHMFAYSKFNQPLDNWKINPSANLSYMFSNSVYSQALPGWKLENTANTEGMFKNTPLEGRENELLQKGAGKEIPEKISFDTKEDLQNYIKDYCGKHGWDSDLNHIDTSRITDMSDLFADTEFTGDISKWDVSNVKDMSWMFEKCPFNGDISKWDTSNVTMMAGLFTRSEFNQPINDWNTGNVINMSNMFMDSKFNQPLDNWNVSNVRNMENMFTRSQFNQPIGNWDTSKLERMSEMFLYGKIDQDLSAWDISKVKDMSTAFANSSMSHMPSWKVDSEHVHTFEIFDGTALEGRESEIRFPKPDPVKITDKARLKSYIENYCDRNGWDSDLNHIDVSEIKDMSGLFAGTKFMGDISKWDVSNVTDMRAMFKNSYFNGNLSEWNTKNVENMSRMFDNSRFNGDITNWNIENVKYMNSMFLDSYFTGDISKLDIPKLADTEDMFADSEYELQHPNWRDEIELQQSRQTPKEETLKQDNIMATKEEKTERQQIILSPEQLMDRALEAAASGNGKWLNHKSIRSPQMYGYSDKNHENTLSGFQQVLLSLNSHENQYHTNIYVTRKGMSDNNLALEGDQKGILLPCPDGTSKQFFNLEQLDQSTVKDGYANSLLAKSKMYKTLQMSETDDVTRNKELLDRDPTSIVLFRKGGKFFLYEESAMRLHDLTNIEIRTTPETGVKYTSFKDEDIDRYIKAISDSGHRVSITNSAYSFKGTNIRSIENRAIRHVQTLAANEGFAIGRVTYMPSNYMPNSDTVSLNVTGKERSTLNTLREIGEIYHAGLEALYSESRLAGHQKLSMGQRQGRKFSQLVLEVATGVQMLRNGLPAVISDENIPLIPYWQQELRENPKAMNLLETHVNALTEVVERSLKGHQVDYDMILPSKKNIERKENTLRPEEGTISRTLGDYTSLQEKKFVVIRDNKDSTAIVIFPTGASTTFDKDTPGFVKDDIHDVLLKENFNQVYFFTPDGFESMNKPNEFFKDLQISVEKMHYGKLEKKGKIDVGEEIKRTVNPEFAAIVPFINATAKRRELYIRTTAGEEMTVPLSKKSVETLAATVKQKDRAAANQTRLNVALNYYMKAKANPEIMSDYLHPNIPKEKYDLIERVRVTKDENNDYFIGARIDGKEYPLREMTFADKSLFIFSENRVSFKKAIATRAFAEELGLAAKADIAANVSGRENEEETETRKENKQEEQPRRGFRR